MSTKVVYMLIQLMEGMGAGSFFPIYTPWLELHGLNFFKMGAVNFFYHLSSSVIDPFTGFFADKFGKRRAFLIGQMFWTATQYIYGASSNIPGFLFAEATAAIGGSLKSDALEGWLKNNLSEDEAKKTVANSRVLFSAGQICTSILAGYVSYTYGMQVAWFLSGTFFLIASLLGLVVLSKTGKPLIKKETPSVSIKEAFRFISLNKKILTSLVIAMILDFASKPVFMYWPQVVTNLGLDIKNIGWPVIAITVPSAFGSYLVGKNIFFNSNQMGLNRMLIVLGLGLQIAYFSGNSGSLATFLIGLTLIEITYGVSKVIFYGHTFQEIPEKYAATILSVISASRTAGSALSLLVMGYISDYYNSPHVAYFFASVSVLAGILLISKFREQDL